MGAYIGQIVNMICNSEPQVKIQSQLDVDYYTPTMGTIAESDEENHWYSKR
jgi:hypothetical protein